MTAGRMMLVASLVMVMTGACKKKAKDGDPGATAGSGSGSAVVAADAAVAEVPDAAAPPAKEAVTMLPADMKWTPLDPSAGDKGPSVVWLWGDATKEANGFLIKLPPGSKGVAHTHSGDYHGVSIAGAPNHLQPGQAKPKMLPALGYWFQPAGVPHTSQCLGKEPCMGLAHFNEGKFDFAPAEVKKDGKPDPKHVEKLEKDLKWVAMDEKAGDKGPMFASVWGDMQSGPNGMYFKMPAGMASPAHTHTADYHAVVIRGTVMNHSPDDKAPKEMPPGSYYMQPGNGPHITACKAGAECVSYVYMTGKFDFAPAGGDAAGAGSAAAPAAAGSGSAGSAAAGSATK